mmetsp:Transcript_87163/g.191525  ORF Transcript_87163/g.191525 Transcript_87163/m.191525 type:complete len:200 (+) Transcript_87163:543-1142(+)
MRRHRALVCSASFFGINGSWKRSSSAWSISCPARRYRPMGDLEAFFRVGRFLVKSTKRMSDFLIEMKYMEPSTSLRLFHSKSLSNRVWCRFQIKCDTSLNFRVYFFAAFADNLFPSSSLTKMPYRSITKGLRILKIAKSPSTNLDSSIGFAPTHSAYQQFPPSIHGFIETLMIVASSTLFSAAAVACTRHVSTRVQTSL